MNYITIIKQVIWNMGAPIQVRTTSFHTGNEVVEENMYPTHLKVRYFKSLGNLGGG